ncbi:MAG: 2-oxoacid:acceptor oxidoreductase family protein [Pseudomonadota bacterium]
MRQQIAISGLGGQGVLLLTRLLAETALAMGLDAISSETHGMAMRGGAVVSHLKIGPWPSPLIRAGQADVAFFLARENLTVHPHLIGDKTRVFVNGSGFGPYEIIDASRLAEETAGTRQVENMALLGFALGRNSLFCNLKQLTEALAGLGRKKASLEAGLKALNAGFAQA